MRGGENHLFSLAIGHSKLRVTPPALPSLTGFWDYHSKSLRLPPWDRPSMTAPPRDGPASRAAAHRLPGLSLGEPSPPRFHGLAPHRGWDLAWRTAGTAAVGLPGSARSGRALSHERFLAEEAGAAAAQAWAAASPPPASVILRAPGAARPPARLRWGCSAGRGWGSDPGRPWQAGFATGAAPGGDERRSEYGDLGDAAGTGSSGAPSALGWGWVAAQTVRGSPGSREGALPVSREPVCWHRAVPGRGDHFWRSRALGGRSIQFSQVPRAREALGAGRGLLGIPEVKQEGVRVPETSVCLRSPWGDRAMPLSLPGRNRLGGCGWGRERARGDQRLYWGFCFAQRGAVTVRHGPQSFFGAIGRRISSCGRGSAGSESPGVRDLGSGTTPQHCLWFSVSNGFDPVPFLYMRFDSVLSWKIDRGSCLVGDTVGLFCCFFSLPRDPFGDALCCRLSSELRRSDTDLGMLSGWWFVCLFVCRRVSEGWERI